MGQGAGHMHSDSKADRDQLENAAQLQAPLLPFHQRNHHLDLEAGHSPRHSLTPRASHPASVTPRATHTPRKVHTPRTPCTPKQQLYQNVLAQHAEAARRSRLKEVILDGIAVVVWMVLSTALVFQNKYLMTYYGFRFPIALTLWHMAFCSAFIAPLVWMGRVKRLDIPDAVYFKCVVPVAMCYAGSLCLSNVAYRLCSISFVQMVKASMPLMVYATGVVCGTESFKWVMLLDVGLIMTGVCISTYGEEGLVVAGLIALVLALAMEAVRLVLTQSMLQLGTVKFDPFTTLYYVAPASMVVLAVPFMMYEAPAVAAFLATGQGLGYLLFNGATAFGLNLSVYILIGRTSALTLNISGTIKDLATISLSVMLFHSVVSTMNVIGYLVTFSGVLLYNALRLRKKAVPEPPSPKQQQLAHRLSLDCIKPPHGAITAPDPQWMKLDPLIEDGHSSDPEHESCDMQALIKVAPVTNMADHFPNHLKVRVARV